ncbi:hypothetical protein SAMN05421863_104822 [Nitrosomonas communis]|uniref:Uncharacterized protein n=1 Tax=Nitrosomonas communis TaxID=44574 RepID=A0A1I4T9Q5_9PROT|nr:hypothetical protein SAMN05421863_104822 [Nitrosomonas communis]
MNIHHSKSMLVTGQVTQASQVGVERIMGQKEER